MAAVAAGCRERIVLDVPGVHPGLEGLAHLLIDVELSHELRDHLLRLSVQSAAAAVAEINVRAARSAMRLVASIFSLSEHAVGGTLTLTMYLAILRR